jgi:hypothetical protein
MPQPNKRELALVVLDLLYDLCDHDEVDENLPDADLYAVLGGLGYHWSDLTGQWERA